MNILQLATAVGQRLSVNTTDPNSRDGAAVRAFLKIRHDWLWRTFLWKDSLLEFVTPINPSTPYVPNANYMPTKGRVIIPSIVGHVLGARLGCRALDVQRPMIYYRPNRDHFLNSGCTYDFTLLSSCVWEFDTAQNLTLNNANVADNNQNATIDELQSDGSSVVRSVLAMNNAGVAAGNTDRIDNFIKPATQGNVSLSVGATAISTLGATDLSAPKCQRIQLVGKPTGNIQNSNNLSILCKRVTPTYSADTDVSAVNGFDAILFELAYYDFIQRRQKGGTPDAVAALQSAVGSFLTNGIAGGLLLSLIKEEVVQEANNSRIIPSEGFGGCGLYENYYYDKGDVYGFPN